jgi:hypothetical protein
MVFELCFLRGLRVENMAAPMNSKLSLTMMVTFVFVSAYSGIEIERETDIGLLDCGIECMENRENDFDAVHSEARPASASVCSNILLITLFYWDSYI